MRKRTIWAALLIAIVALGTVLFLADYLDPKKKLLGEAQTAQANGNYALAVEKYGLFLGQYSDSSYWADAFIGKLDSYYGLVSQLITEKKYDEAIRTYFAMSDEYPHLVTSANDTVLKDIPADVLLSWGKEFQPNNETLALRFYDLILQYHPQSSSATEADTAMIGIQIRQCKGGNSLIPYETTFVTLGGKAEIVVINDSPYQMTVLVNGSSVRKVIIKGSPNSGVHYFSPYIEHYNTPSPDANRVTITLNPGRCEIAVIGNGTGAMYDLQFLSADCRVTYSVYVKSSFRGFG